MVYTNVPKGVSYRVMLLSTMGTDDKAPVAQISIDNYALHKISKDGGPWQLCVNKAVHVASGCVMLTLTDEEMNADRIDVYVGSTTTGSIWTSGCQIITGSPLAGNQELENVSDLSTINPTVNQVLRLLWEAMTQTSGKSGWSYKKWFNRFNW